ncbi:hypothetical protein LTR44_003765 [Exophiala sp. CCFEE 6388]|nr:hypothetical protein LTR44_003765 [Eurotiomycetes sp. CCFEE 6388]
MSGVEAIFGVVTGAAGLLSLGIELGESAAKLRSLYHAVKDAPKTISELASSLETMAMALSWLEIVRQRDPSSGDLLARCITDCERRTAEIKQAVDEMSRRLTNHRRIYGRLYTAFKEPAVKKLLDDLERAKSSLQLVYINYEQMRRRQEQVDMLAMLRAEFQDLRAQISAGRLDVSQQLTLLSQTVTPPQQHQLTIPNAQAVKAWPMTTNSAGVIVTTCKNGIVPSDQAKVQPPSGTLERRHSTMHRRIRLRLFAWLSSRIWDLSVSCRVDLTTYNVVLQNSDIFHYCRKGDLEAVRRLIESGRASPLDVYDSSGASYCTLIEVAAQGAEPVRLCQYLLEQTTWPDQAAVLNKALIHYGINTRVHHDERMYRVFFKAEGFDAEFDKGRPWMNWLQYCRTARCLDFALKSQFNFHDLPPEDRFEVFIQSSSRSNPTCSEFLGIIGLSRSDRKVATLRTHDGTTVLFYVACRIAMMNQRGSGFNAMQDWLSLGASVLRMGADPCSLGYPENKNQMENYATWQALFRKTGKFAHHGVTVPQD